MIDISFDQRLANRAVLEQKVRRSDRLLKAWTWKSGLESSFPLIVCLVGGTGTGKSTLFNSLAGRPISQVGKLRPSTVRPMILAHKNVAEALTACPFLSPGAGRHDSPGSWNDVVSVHEHDDIAGLILVDTPDFDSVELAHHGISDDFFIISDVIVFVTSQEKYGDLAGHHVSQKALDWGKTTMFVMNKVASEDAYNDFTRTLTQRGHDVKPVRIERLTPQPSLIPGLRDRCEFANLFARLEDEPDRLSLRTMEMARLRQKTAAALDELIAALVHERQRIDRVNSHIAVVVTQVVREMQDRLDAVVSQDMETRIRERLQLLLRKYDILFVPRSFIRDTIKKAFFTTLEWLGLQETTQQSPGEERALRTRELQEARSVARLDPVDAAIAKLNLRIAELLCSDAAMEDLCKIAQSDVPRWGQDEIRRLYDAAFPGVEALLEREFQRLRDGISSTDELKLYGSYTLWALLLITFEITVLGGSAILDALLSTVIMPFIPKWVLDQKVVNLLREIAVRLEREHRETLQDIVTKQAQLYARRFDEILPVREKLLELGQKSSELKGHVITY